MPLSATNWRLILVLVTNTVSFARKPRVRCKVYRPNLINPTMCAVDADGRTLAGWCVAARGSRQAALDLLTVWRCKHYAIE